MIKEMRTENHIYYTYESIEELAKTAVKHRKEYAEKGSGSDYNWMNVDSWDHAYQLGLNGWNEELPETMSVVESAVEKVEKEHEMKTFHPVWDVSGCEVDVARFLSKEPENMIDYEIVPTTKVGRVIILCASVSYSSAISNREIKKRGRMIAALALVLSHLGYTTELWADSTSSPGFGSGGSQPRGTMGTMRTLVKGANDALDPAKIMFAYAHPAMLRCFSLAGMHEFPNEWQEKLGAVFMGGYGMPTDPPKDLPEGTIYLPAVRSDKDIPDLDKALVDYLKDLGVISE